MFFVYFMISLFLLWELYAGQLVLVAQHSGPLRELLALWPHGGQLADLFLQSTFGARYMCFFNMCPGTIQ